MNERANPPRRLQENSKQRNYLIAAWSVLIILSAAWNIYFAHHNNQEKARIEARTLYELNLVYRRWSALHGGVYVPVTDTLQPNPYLKVTDRDILASNGKKYTLVNPAWMTRQVFEFLAKQSDPPIINHLSSKKYINPVNQPDAWEDRGLSAFEQGKTEFSERLIMNDEPYMRLLKPFKVETGCLKCHGHQGYALGDIRGGISIAIPMRPYLAADKRDMTTIFLSHFILWSIGAGGIIISTRSLRSKEQRLTESEEKYRLLFESNPHPMWVYDRETQAFLMVNDAAVRAYGYSREEFLAITMKEILHPEEVQGTAGTRMLSAAEKTGAVLEQHVKKGGALIYVEITSHPLEFEKRPAMLVMANDVTDNRRLEDQLRHAQKMDAVGRLAGGVAHDFNNILTAIIGYGSLMKMKMKADDPLRHSAEEVVASAQRGAALTQNLLAFSRKQAINPGRVDINNIVARISKLLQRLIGEDIRLETKLVEKELIVIADSGQMEQVLMNLATNSRDAMQSGGTLSLETSTVTIDERFVSVHNYGKPGKYAQIAMTDTGSGMDKKTLERIFEPFFTTKEVGRGTGLGLSMIYGIVKQHEGYVNAYSEPNRGTTFKIYLPLAGERIVDVQPQEQSIKGGTETILVAEDDEPLRRLAKSVLQEFGYNVIEAVDGEDALDKIRLHRESIQLLLLDVIMPKKNGKQVYEESRTLVPKAKTLFLSGYTADIVQKRGILDPGQSFISKPLSPSDLLKKIREILDS